MWVRVEAAGWKLKTAARWARQCLQCAVKRQRQSLWLMPPQRRELTVSCWFRPQVAASQWRQRSLGVLLCWRLFSCWCVFGWQPWKPAGWLVCPPEVRQTVLLLE